MAIVGQPTAKRWAQTVRLSLEEGEAIETLAKSCGVSTTQILRAGVARLANNGTLTTKELDAVRVPQGRRPKAAPLGASLAKPEWDESKKFLESGSKEKESRSRPAAKGRSRKTPAAKPPSSRATKATRILKNSEGLKGKVGSRPNEAAAQRGRSKTPRSAVAKGSKSNPKSPAATK